jgi:hypothetical protein
MELETGFGVSFLAAMEVASADLIVWQDAKYDFICTGSIPATHPKTKAPLPFNTDE